MTDISKVVQEMREAVQDGEPMKFRYLSQWADRLESATAPEEVGDGMVLDPIRVLESEETFLRIVHGDDTANEHMRAVATLARQLAEANSWRDAVINELVAAFIYTKEHDSNPRKAVQDAITWNCQVSLDPRVSSDAAALIEPYKSQLAEATRRLGEVEGLVGKWRESANGERDYYSDALRAAATQLEAALTKEPTK